MNKKEEALNYLISAFECGFRDFPYIGFDADLDNLRGDTVFVALMNKWKIIGDHEIKAVEGVVEGGEIADTTKQQTIVIPIQKQRSGTYEITCRINSLPMKIITVLSSVCMGLFFVCCSGGKSDRKVRSIKTDVIEQKRITIIIQPFSGFSDVETDAVGKELRRLYKKVVVKKSLPYPANSLSESKARYRADSLICFLGRRTGEEEVTIGLTNKDISTKKGVYADWGVFGLGFCPGRACIASSYRLKGKNRSDKLFKVSIHELGHTQGLKHCPIKNCLMRDAAGKDHLNELTGFCAGCKAHLKKRGWVLRY